MIHLLVVVLFGGKVLFNRYIEPPDFQSTGDGGSTVDAGPSTPPEAPEVTLPPQPAMAPPVSSPALASLTSLNPNATGFAKPIPAIAPPTISKNLAARASVQQFGTGPAVTLPGVMSQRLGSGRKSAGEKYGAVPVSEEAVLRALQWLQSQQQTAGTWGSSAGYQDAFTGLTLLCFLGHGETPQTSHEFGVVVNSAINALVSQGNSTQGRFGGGPDFSDDKSPYQHAICTYAMCEAYTMTRDERIAPIIKQAVGYIVKGQRPDGGWGYGYDLSGDAPSQRIKSDTSISGWQIQALKAAHLTGIPGMDQMVRPALDLAMKNMDRVFNPKDGTFGYRNAGDRDYTLTGVGLLAKLFWIGRPDRAVYAGLKNIQSKDLKYDGPDCNLYAWYYDTQACYQAQGGAWDWWKGRFQNQLTGKQSADGSWPPPAGDTEAGRFAKDPAGDGPVYRTALCCLMLEVFYRYLPTSGESALSGGTQGL